jgi:flagellin
VSGVDSTFGAVQDRLQYTMANLSTYEQNLTSANSTIMDVDMASAMTNFTSEQVLQQAGTAMLSQAQKLPDAVLSLLQGA